MVVLDCVPNQYGIGRAMSPTDSREASGLLQCLQRAREALQALDTIHKAVRALPPGLTYKGKLEELLDALDDALPQDQTDNTDYDLRALDELIGALVDVG